MTLCDIDGDGNVYEEDDEYPETCTRCDGEGYIVGCCDDICHGQGWCMHGDNITCPECNGEGEL